MEYSKNRMGRIATEESNPRTRRLSSLPIESILKIINDEDRQVPDAVRREIPVIAKVIVQIVKRLEEGGRLIYVGAGTSGRLGVLDASELIPTFGAGPEIVRAIIAGGKRAAFRPIEGAEDNQRSAVDQLKKMGLCSRDVVLGISASGNTPFVTAALRFAKARNAEAIALTSNPHSTVFRYAHIVICPRTGPEVLSGSTRMKAGTAQKLVLNMVSTVAMLRLGRVHGNLMVGLRPTNRKLIERATRIVATETGLKSQAAFRKLKEARVDVRVAILMARENLGYQAARKLLKTAHGSLEKALELGKRARSFS